MSRLKDNLIVNTENHCPKCIYKDNITRCDACKLRDYKFFTELEPDKKPSKTKEVEHA